MTNLDARLPQGSCDCHVHIYGPSHRYPVQREGKFAPQEDFPVDRLMDVWSAIGVSRGVIVHSNYAGRDHEVTLDALRRFPDRLRGIAVLDRDVSDSRLDELTDAGFKGIRVNLLRQDGKIVQTGGTTFEDLQSLAPRLAERGWHAQLWIESNDLQACSSELEKLPLQFVIDHQTRTMADKTVNDPGFQWFCNKLKEGRYWCKLSGADRNTRRGRPYSDTEAFTKALVAANPDRLVWGTDWPHVGHAQSQVPSEVELVDLFFRCVPQAHVQAKVLIENPQRLYGFDPL